jgi:leucyl-tRNA synthetase
MHYADKLLEGLSDIDWIDSTKRQKIAWIGKSEGANIYFKIDDHNEDICIYITLPDAIFGITFLVLVPEHPLVEKIFAPKFTDDVKNTLNIVKRRATWNERIWQNLKRSTNDGIRHNSCKYRVGKKS